MNFLREMVRLTDLAILYADENDCTDREGAYAIETALSSIQSLRLFIANGDSTEEYASGYDDEGNACHHRDDALAEFINLYWWKETEYQNRTTSTSSTGYCADDILILRSDAALCPDLANVAEKAPKANDSPYQRRSKNATHKPDPGLARVQQSSKDAQLSSPRWPWGYHHTELLGYLDAAAKKFWALYDPSDPSTAPTNQMVSDWLQREHRVSIDKANAIASILRPDGLRTGPRR